MTDKQYLIHDATMDMLRGLNKLTDMECPDTAKIRDLATSIKSLEKTAHYDRTSGELAGHGSWGDADKDARKHFERLEKAYMGFWRCAAEYAKHPSEETKYKIVSHFKEQLSAHDALAAFVKGNCPAVCPEVKAALQEWAESKHDKPAA